METRVQIPLGLPRLIAETLAGSETVASLVPFWSYAICADQGMDGVRDRFWQPSLAESDRNLAVLASLVPATGPRHGRAGDSGGRDRGGSVDMLLHGIR